MCGPLFSLGVYATEHESSLCALSAQFPPSIVSCLLRLFYLGEQGFGCDGGSTGEVVAVVVMVAVVAAGKRRERVTCWTTFLCSCGGWCRLRGGGGQSRIIIALQGIMNGLLFRGSLCPHLLAATLAYEGNGGRENEQQSYEENMFICSSDQF